MSKENSLEKWLEEIRLYIKYAVPEGDQPRALSFVDQHKQDRLILALLREYYSTLPEAREEGIVRIATLMTRQGVFLLVAITESNAYLYAVSDETIVFLGEYGSEVDEQLLSHFNFKSQSAFLEKCREVDELKDYKGSRKERSSICSACGVAEGEFHLLGCTVEVCPWCEGHLSNCNCRFEQLEVDEVETADQLNKFYDLLTAKGRASFKGDQSPSYPGTGDGLDRREEEG